MGEFYLKSDEVSEAIGRMAAIEDELESLGANDLVIEQGKLRAQLKTYLTGLVECSTPLTIKGGTSAYDEVSGWEAIILQRNKDEWDIEKLREGLTDKQKTRYITLHVDKDAMKEGIENGALSRAKLESVGAVHKAPYSYALHVRERKTNNAPI